VTGTIILDRVPSRVECDRAARRNDHRALGDGPLFMSIFSLFGRDDAFSSRALGPYRQARHAANPSQNNENEPRTNMTEVQIYATAICPYCVRARNLLQRKGVAYQEIRVDRDRDQLRVMIQRSKRTTVPQIFIGDDHIGGFDDMARLDDAGKLDALLHHHGIATVQP
jgi:glutaredoxin 3